MKNDFFSTSDGKRYNYYIFGEKRGTPIFFFHGFPGTGKQARFLIEDSRYNQDFHIIALDRPGYGLSDPQENLSLRKFANDIDELSSHLNVSQFITMGVSGGGPYAAAVAHYLPRKVIKASSVCGVAPVSPRNVIFLNNQHRKIYLLKKLLPTALFNFFAEKLVLDDLKKLEFPLTENFKLKSQRDRDILANPNIGPFLFSTFKDAVNEGTKGLLTDIDIFTKSWGFAVEEINVPYYLWHGDSDEIIHPEMSSYMQKNLRKAHFRIVEGEGHYSLPFNYREMILEELLFK